MHAEHNPAERRRSSGSIRLTIAEKANCEGRSVAIQSQSGGGPTPRSASAIAVDQRDDLPVTFNTLQVQRCRFEGGAAFFRP